MNKSTKQVGGAYENRQAYSANKVFVHNFFFAS